MNKNLSAALIAAMTLLGASSLTACNTLEGAGKDVERAGEKIQDSNCTREDAASDPNCNR